MRLGWKESKWMGQLRVGARDYVHLFIPSLRVPDIKWMGQLRVGARDYVHLFIPSLPVPDYLQLAFYWVIRQ